ncbi:MAG: NAD(P)/FAD-dependent oxidoreductase [Dehalococcoidia bacterium]|nr:NAD(P)/FAD-dependent oxidoreductase [Dehalococcoidia bacterium]MCK5182152.1 NAD(P)/FAD-dependent oxidoreductase [Dehalococcoidia bacterium]
MDYDVLIIGAGMSGLAAGIRLAYYDKRVCIVEKHHRVGGLNSFYNLRGRKFDVGLHAVTNYVPKGVKLTPLPKLLRQLKLKREDFALCPQRVSAIKFPDKTLKFNNDLDFFVQDVVDNFTAQADNFQRLLKTIFEYDELNLYAKPISAREVVGSIISDPLLIDMVFCPLMFYGNAQENDIEFGQFVIMFKGIYCEGFARPQAGVRQILDVLVRKYRSCGGELKTRCAVTSIQAANNRIESVTLDNGEVLTANRILSSAGYVETMRLLSNYDPTGIEDKAGQLSMVEFITVLNRQPAEMGHETTIIFYNNSDRFDYRKPDELVNVSSGVICCPNNFQYENPLPEGMIRITNLANFDLWNRLNEEEYKAQKAAWLGTSLSEVVKLIPDFRDSIVFTDVFTPKTIHRFTGHINGAVYGTPNKMRMGMTHLENLFICGTDQGFLGIVGAMLSGISMANLHALQKA